MPNLELDRYKQRLGAIVDGPAKRWQEHFANDSKTMPLANLLIEFTQFARDYFEFFTQAEPLTSLSRELNSALANLQRDWELISRACAQREIDEYHDFLMKADAQVQDYYGRFVGYKILHVAPITYFEKLYAISRSAFTPYPLISIPLVMFNAPAQWLALTHELGHFIYWNSAPLATYRKAQAQLKTAVLKALSVSTESYADFQGQRKVVDVWINWLEETFADVCATLLGGPAYALSGQRLLEEVAYTPDELAADDEEHPAAYLRPQIALETLAWKAEQLADSAQKTKLENIIVSLAERWDQYLGGDKAKARSVTHTPSELKMREIEAGIRPVVRAILGGNGGAASWIGAAGESRNLGELIDCSAWLNELSTVTTAVGKDRIPELPARLRDLTEPQAVTPGSREEDRIRFADLVNYLQSNLKTDKKVRQALLSLPLEEDPAVCTQKVVKRVGQNKGDFKLC